MDFSRDLVDYVAKTGGVANFRGWYYDLVLERLEKIGFRRRAGLALPPGSGAEGSVYENDSGAKIEVFTHRFAGVTFMNSLPSPKKPEPKG